MTLTSAAGRDGIVSMHIALHRSFPNFLPDEHCADLGLTFRTTADGAELATYAGDCDVLILNGPTYSRALAENLSRPGARIKFIQFISAGYENAEFFGVPAGTKISNGSTIWAPMVAEHAVALLMAVLRQMPMLERRRVQRVWDRGPLLGTLGSLEEARIAILGHGTIGEEIARRLKPFGAEVIGVARSAKPAVHADRVVPMSELPALLPTLKALINAVPAGPATLKLVDAAMLERLPGDAVLVNVGRGATVDEDALLAHLRAGKIAGAGLDVFATEPLPPDNPLWSLENVVISPHCAGFGSPAVMRRAHDLCRRNILNFRDGKELISPVTL